ncbi:MAG: hypothetical protein CVT60_00705 [Actinobacteria bacterium HGW-Actinobacteria-10]|nr:MAG: hypothetical protein CVT60_00705 [Actinobacteria bacterium HGW-Actinobacteria-10]
MDWTGTLVVLGLLLVFSLVANRAFGGVRVMRRLAGTLGALLVCAALLVGAVGCEPVPPWTAADEQLAALARHIAERAEQGDTNYFRGLTVQTQMLPALMERVSRSGIATNYAEHLEVQADGDAILVYSREDDPAQVASFTVRLSLHDGKPRVDQIIVGETSGEVTARIETLFKRSPVPAEKAATRHVSVSLAPGSLRAGAEWPALIGYANTSSEDIWVPQPLGYHVIITDIRGEQVWIWGPFGSLPQTGSTHIAPLEALYGAVRFTAPEPGSYLLYARANGTMSAATKIEVAAD